MHAFSRAAEGIRTLDLLHGKQLLISRRIAETPCKWGASVEGGRAGDVRGLLAITDDSANQLQTVRGVPAYGARAGP
jgi:hypothetical protein